MYLVSYHTSFISYDILILPTLPRCVQFMFVKILSMTFLSSGEITTTKLNIKQIRVYFESLKTKYLLTLKTELSYDR